MLFQLDVSDEELKEIHELYKALAFFKVAVETLAVDKVDLISEKLFAFLS